MSDSPLTPAPPEPRSVQRLRRFFLGAPRSLGDSGLFHKLSLVPFLAWVGLGADGLSSSSYGPDEAFRALGDKTYLALAIAALMAITIAVIAAAYSLIIEKFPHGGGGYLAASKLLGAKVGAVSGAALLIDYVMTIAVSIAAAGSALFSFLPAEWRAAQLPLEVMLILLLTLLNLRGVRESVLALVPIFLVFVATHLVLILGGIILHAPELPETMAAVGGGFNEGLTLYGAGGLLLAFMFAYSMGGGTYTGIEAVSNAMPLMREPRVKTARRTMLYMAVSLAFTAAGLMVCYLLWRVSPVEGKTMNAVLAEAFASGWPAGRLFVDRHPGVRGGAARRRRPGGFHGRPAHAGQHGRRLLGAAPLRRDVRAADHAERHPAHGSGGVGGPALHGRQRHGPGRDVQHQRLPHLLALPARHAALGLCAIQRRGGTASGAVCSSPRASCSA